MSEVLQDLLALPFLPLTTARTSLARSHPCARFQAAVHPQTLSPALPPCPILPPSPSPNARSRRTAGAGEIGVSGSPDIGRGRNGGGRLPAGRAGAVLEILPGAARTGQAAGPSVPDGVGGGCTDRPPPGCKRVGAPGLAAPPVPKGAVGHARCGLGPALPIASARLCLTKRGLPAPGWSLADARVPRGECQALSGSRRMKAIARAIP